ncbi:hypothetical protein [Acidianus bottle-shaped virus]|uniref:Putative transmembrane protein ORF166 n=1 Tax=Acidianus bottle-shaped virus (isolate Italy/Pozzuoli) TaxID=654911 RepID=Y166_ABVP|nr:hypothetical protein ABV_gp44 [Acidianus bottle-shaped virus]A4ZUD0.1 RecName: Full=Putative transmembrane protein ORF166 [Acidianus bottle-shaped virus (isolate Pozzuoli)]ABP73434.1 hypothetical protein [Acidianus bottle-shaped virus]
MAEIGEFLKKYAGFCGLLPPSVDNSLLDFLANLPIILVFLITMPVRFFICIFAGLAKVNPICVLINLLPPLAIAIPFVTAQTPPVCSTQCQYCQSGKGECLNYNPTIAKYFTQCEKQLSVLNKIFCLVGIIIADVLNPILAFINPLIYLAIHKVICLNTNPCICGL